MNSNEKLLFAACEKGNLEQAINLMEQGVDINIQDEVSNEDHYFKTDTPLMKAAQNGHFEIVKFLVENGADINIDDRQVDSNALEKAINIPDDLNDEEKKTRKTNIEKIVKYLIEKGIKIKNYDDALGLPGCKALEAASYYGLEDTVKLLMEHGAVMDEEDE